MTLVCGPVCQTTPRGVARIGVAGALDMHREVMARAATQDVFIGVAAVADYRPQAAAEHKIKNDGKVPTVELVETPTSRPKSPSCQNPPRASGPEPQPRRVRAEEREKKKIPLIAGNPIRTVSVARTTRWCWYSMNRPDPRCHRDRRAIWCESAGHFVAACSTLSMADDEIVHAGTPRRRPRYPAPHEPPGCGLADRGDAESTNSPAGSPSALPFFLPSC